MRENYYNPNNEYFLPEDKLDFNWIDLQQKAKGAWELFPIVEQRGKLNCSSLCVSISEHFACLKRNLKTV